MARDEVAMTRLRKVFRRYRSLVFPSAGGSSSQLDLLADLATEDAYLAGLVDSFLVGRPVPGSEILLDASLDARIELERACGSSGAHELGLIAQYRIEMHTLALELSRASGVPIRESDKDAQPLESSD